MCVAFRERELTGSLAYQTGRSAEESAKARYRDAGFSIRDERVRAPRGSGAGELDIVAERDGKIVFVEVKKSQNFARAAASLTMRQLSRLALGAEAYLGALPRGLNTDCRLDVALVNAVGEVEILENVYAA